MENFYLSSLVGELRWRLIGRHVGAVLLSGANIVFDLRPADGETLFASLDRTSPTLFLSSKTLKQQARESNSSSPFVAHLKKRVAGAEIIAIAKPAPDRVVHFQVEKYDLAGNRERTHLVLAMTGRSANAYLFNFDERLIAMMDERGELPRDEMFDLDPEQVDVAALSEGLSDDLSESQIEEQFFNGNIFGPQLKREFAARCRTLAPAEAMRSLLSDLFDHAPQPFLYSRLPFDEAASRLINLKNDLLLSHIPLVQAAGFARREFASLSEAAEAYQNLRAHQRQLRNEYDQTRQLLAQAVKRLETTLAAIGRDHERFDEPERLKRYGDLLLANLATARVEGATARVIDYFDDEQPEVVIEIIENRPLQQTAARYFAQYQKAQRALAAINERERQVATRLAPLRQLLASLQPTATASEIAATRTAAERALGIKRKAEPVGEKKAKKKSATTSRRFRTTDGFEVLVGKSDRENDELTFRTARPTDIWLHAADYPGSHVVIRNPARGEVPPRSIAEAAELAAFYSQAKREAKAAVHYTQRKFISKPPRAKPGLVRLSSFKTILVEPRCAIEKIE
jgi:predicted ribosome quality control (RQC) complex YloA/Tae2 family protein